MTSPDRLDPLSFTGCFAELDSDIPPGVTLLAWRSQRARSNPKRPQIATPSTGEGEGGAGADLAPRDRTLRVRGRAHRPRRGRGPSARRNR